MQLHNRPTAPPIDLRFQEEDGGLASLVRDGGAACAGASAATDLPPLVVWRQSFPFNYMEFIRRVLGEASTWLALPTPAVVYMPLSPPNATLPPYVRHILKPFAATIVTAADARALLHAARRLQQPRPRPLPPLFASAALCCVRKPAKLDAARTRAVIRSILAAHGADAPLPTNASTYAAYAAAAAAAAPPFVAAPRFAAANVLIVARTPPAPNTSSSDSDSAESEVVS